MDRSNGEAMCIRGGVIIKINSAPTTEPAAPPTNNPVAPTALAEIQMAEPSEPDLDSPSAQENPNATLTVSETNPPGTTSSYHYTTAMVEPKSRTVGNTERSWCQAVRGGTGIAVLALLTSKPPDIPKLQTSLRTLQTSHPILSSRLQTLTFSFIPTSYLPFI